MTQAEIARAERDAESDAEWLGLLLLLAFRAGTASKLQDVHFDAAQGKFYVNGRAVSSRSIIAYLERMQDRIGRKVLQLTKDLTEQRITMDEWKRGFDTSIKTSHILAGAFALGSIAAAVRSVIVLDQIDEQLVFADKFAEEIRADAAGSPFRIRARARSYMQAAHLTFAKAELDFVKATGFRKEARNIMRPAEHCKTKERIGCPALSFKGWMPVDEMVPVGHRQCGIYCRCYVIYR